ncbi:MAG: flagellar hook-basal body complex protein FliE [Anaerolineae bacterium]|nr:flagellar hook-basal body complex protein FliE [Anaerolineae bacterium]
MAINPISPLNINGLGSVGGAPKTPASGNLEKAGQSFEKMLSSLDQSQKNSDELVKQLSLGESTDLHTVMIGLEENDVNFRVAMAIRDKLVDAYREVMRMQI